MRVSLKHIPVSLVLLVGIIIMLSGGVHASENEYDRLASLSSETLYRQGTAWHDSSPDSAMICYSLIESRYNPKMSDKEKILCVDALIKKWQICYYRNFDFASAYENLSKAQEIAEDGGLVLPAIDLQLGILYQTISEQCDDPGAAVISFNKYRKGFRDALAGSATTIQDVLASNLAHLAFLIDSLDVIKTDWDRYVALGDGGRDFKYRYNIHQYEGLKLLKNNDYSGANKQFDSMIALEDSLNVNVRYQIGVTLYKALVMMSRGDYDNAANLLLNPLRVAEEQGIKDIQIELYGKLAECYRKMGKPVPAMEYENKGLRLNDSLINYNQLSRLEEVKSGRNLRKYQERLAVIEAERRLQRVVTTIIAVFLIVVCVLLIVLFNRNRRLKQSNKVLYDKNIDILRQSEKELETRKEYERRLEEMAAREAVAPVEDKILSEKTVEEKYKGSRLDEADKTELLDTIMGVMGSSDEYLQPDFSIERLADLAGSKSKLVSQVINERQGCNFNSFVNEFRIREACRRISDIDRYGRLTLDAISKSVGFRARSSFFTAFKAVTGLTPSEFQKIARSEHK